MRKLYLLVFLGIAMLVSCSESNNANLSSSDQTTNESNDSIQVETTDSIQQLKVENEKKILTTTSEQLSYMQNSPEKAKYENGILLQMAKDAPEYCGKLLASDKSNFLIVDKGKMKVFVYDKYGQIVKASGIACGKNYGTKLKKGDCRTPEGYFESGGVFDSTNWLYTDDYGHTSPAKGVYGPWFIRVTTAIGIHGTSSPGSIGKRTSHGCIRVHNENIKEIKNYVEKGTPIIVIPGPKDMVANQKNGKNMLAVATEVGSAVATPDENFVYHDNSPGISAKREAAASSETENAGDAAPQPTEETQVEEAPKVEQAPEPVQEPKTETSSSKSADE